MTSSASCSDKEDGDSSSTATAKRAKQEGNNSMNGMSAGGGDYQSGGGVSSKFTGRFDIQIENDKEFQVARKLIGSKGSNMKRIIEMCKRGMGPEAASDAVKLRLRGKGSGFREGPMKKGKNK